MILVPQKLSRLHIHNETPTTPCLLTKSATKKHVHLEIFNESELNKWLYIQIINFLEVARRSSVKKYCK